MTSNTRSALVGLFLGTALLLSACGSSGADADDPPAAAVGSSELMPTMPTTSLLEVSTTTVSSDVARSGFLCPTWQLRPPFSGALSEDDRGLWGPTDCWSNWSPPEVVTLTKNGPRPDQAGLAVTALRDCDLVSTWWDWASASRWPSTRTPAARARVPSRWSHGRRSDAFLGSQVRDGLVDLDDDEASICWGTPR
ncbi:MAG: hypothetical protein CM1200mP26_02560 [Acidimicrobiales bacterium]|nr:MAG: hypothetical protein CM1200mP26_02560 [Acidimicrobiales bacterium]